MIICKECGLEKETNRKVFCSESCRNKYKYRNNKEKYSKLSYKSQKKRRHKLKEECISSMGNSCSYCGYNKNKSALSFHHTSIKTIKLDSSSLELNSKDLIKTELQNCILLCLNCHMELHNQNYTLNNFKSEYEDIENLIKIYI